MAGAYYMLRWLQLRPVLLDQAVAGIGSGASDSPHITLPHHEGMRLDELFADEANAPHLVWAIASASSPRIDPATARLASPSAVPSTPYNSGWAE